MSRITYKQRGYTLVEIAIVLVIIGLLLGGVLKGQELINSAQVRNLAAQSSSMQAAYHGFFDRYRRLPGDMPGEQACEEIGKQVPGCPDNGVGGDGNGSIGAGDWKEAAAVWVHLSASGFIQGNYQGSAAGEINENTYRSPPNAPVNAFGGSLLLSHTNSYLSASADQPPIKLNLVLGRQIPVKIIREFDAKMDEGLPASGTVRAVSTGAAFRGVAEDDGTCVGSPQIWDVSQDSSDCNAVILY